MILKGHLGGPERRRGGRNADPAWAAPCQ